MGATATLSIGGLALQLHGGKGVETTLALPGIRVFQTENTTNVDLYIRLDESLMLPDCRWLHRFGILNNTMECRFGIDDTGTYHYTFGCEGLLCFDPQLPDIVTLSPITDPNILRFALWTAYAMAALRLGAVPIHSSVVVHHGYAVLCLGESGTGKSTHTRLWIDNIPDCHLLNDDSPIVRVEGNEVIAYGSPWSGKTPCFLQERVPVAALLRLEQRPTNSIRRLGTIEAFTALHPSCPPALAHDERYTDHMVAFISDVLEHVPVYRLGCLPNTDAALLSHNTIFCQS